MAKPSNNHYAKKEEYAYPSQYGSHASMVDEEATKGLNDTKLVVCKDEHGTYITERNRLDSGLADPNRYACSRGNV